MGGHLLGGVLSFIIMIAFMGCGGSSSGTTDIPSDDTTGSGLNSDWESTKVNCTGTVTGGTFSDSAGAGASVYIKDGEFPACVNATESPTVTAVSSLPTGFDVKTADGDVNATSGGVGFLFDLKSERGFSTNTSGAVTITLPIDTSKVPSEILSTTTVKVFVRIFTHDDSSLIDIIGTVGASSITVESRGLPVQFTAAVIYNSNMTYISTEEISTPASISVLKNVTSNPPWPARRWLVSYNASSATLITAVQNVLGIAVAPTAAQITQVITDSVVAAAKSNQEKYETAGFRAPNISTLNLPTSIIPYETKSHYILHLVDGGSVFQPQDASEIISPDGNRYGRIYIGAGRIDDATTSSLGSIKASTAHETLHAIQNGYELSFTDLTRGYKEGASTVYGMTRDNSDTITVRSSGAEETFLLSNFLMSTGTDADDWAISYANQDFYAYVGKKYNAGALDYISGLFEKIRTEVDANTSSFFGTMFSVFLGGTSVRQIMYGAMDSYFQTTLGHTLNEIYLDFLKQRTFEHNAESQFGRAGETVNGFASDLYADGAGTLDAIEDVTLIASNCGMIHSTGSFGSVAPYAARVVRITATTPSTDATGPTLKVQFTPITGVIGSSWAGYSFRNGAAGTIIAGENTFTDFGRSANEELVFTIANLSDRILSTVNYSVTCELSSSGGGGDNTFDLTTFTLPNITFDPAYIIPATMPNDIMFLLGNESSSSDAQLVPYMVVQINSALVTGAGTYDVSSCYTDDAAGYVSIMFVSPETLTIYCSTSGTADFSVFGSTSGSRVTGTITTTMENILSIVTTGSVKMTFDFAVP